MLGTALLLTLALTPTQRNAIERETFETWLCPLHRDEQSTEADRCPVCERQMVKRLLAPSYSCPMHANIDELQAGDCTVCSMALVPTVRELQWFCPDDPQDGSSVPDTCSGSGKPMEMRSVPMAHGDHNPKHGGILFMAPNGFHHLEGTLDPGGEFRLHLYNDFTKPIGADDFEARIGDESLGLTSDGSYLMAVLPSPSSYPAEVVLHVRFPGAHEDEARFDFYFPDPNRATAAVEEAPALPEFRIPDDSEGIFAEILVRDERVQELISRGGWTDLYIPALEAKELALALSEREGASVEVATKRLVRAAWLLDAYGDLGNRLEVEEAYRLFERAIRELQVAYVP